MHKAFPTALRVVIVAILWGFALVIALTDSGRAGERAWIMVAVGAIGAVVVLARTLIRNRRARAIDEHPVAADDDGASTPASR